MTLFGHGLFKGMDISGSAMTAERIRLNVISANIANSEVTRTPEGGPYRRNVVSFAPMLDELLRAGSKEFKAASGVRIDTISKDMSAFNKVYKPGHPDADKDGNVLMPNVNMVFEMVDFMMAMRSYEANLSAAKSFKEMAEKTLQLTR